ncbi:DNA cytosine methyltransferase [Okeanomitos corallinicola TIOX110]|uniref:DNA cytosine methyltransferase n=1 Tax=Okeanomitos corallinicola TIOX110 TaxID=3133117 RepID=A0ABZ2UZY4_9CYAN
MLRLQGFPEDYQIIGSYQAMRKLAGNSVAIPCVMAVVREVLNAMLGKVL